MRSRFIHSLPPILRQPGDDRHHHRPLNPRHLHRRTKYTSRVVRQRGPAPNVGFRQENCSPPRAHHEFSCSLARLFISSSHFIASITTHLQSPALHELVTKFLLIVYFCILSNSSMLLFFSARSGHVQAFMYKYLVYADPSVCINYSTIQYLNRRNLTRLKSRSHPEHIDIFGVKQVHDATGSWACRDK